MWFWNLIVFMSVPNFLQFKVSLSCSYFRHVFILYYERIRFQGSSGRIGEPGPQGPLVCWQKRNLVSVRPNDNNFVKCLKNKSLAFLTPDNKIYVPQVEEISVNCILLPLKLKNSWESGHIFTLNITDKTYGNHTFIARWLIPLSVKIPHNT